MTLHNKHDNYSRRCLKSEEYRSKKVTFSKTVNNIKNKINYFKSLINNVPGVTAGPGAETPRGVSVLALALAFRG